MGGKRQRAILHRQRQRLLVVRREIGNPPLVELNFARGVQRRALPLARLFQCRADSGLEGQRVVTLLAWLQRELAHQPQVDFLQFSVERRCRYFDDPVHWIDGQALFRKAKLAWRGSFCGGLAVGLLRLLGRGRGAKQLQQVQAAIPVALHCQLRRINLYTRYIQLAGKGLEGSQSDFQLGQR